MCRRNRVVKSSRFRVSRRQGANRQRHVVVRQFTGLFRELNGARSVPETGILAGGQPPCQIVQIDGQKFPVLFRRILVAGLSRQGAGFLRR